MVNMSAPEHFTPPISWNKTEQSSLSLGEGVGGEAKFPLILPPLI